MAVLEQQILRTLLYYDIFSHPLTSREIFLFLPQNSVSFVEFEKYLQTTVSSNILHHWNRHYFLPERKSSVVLHRHQKERLARKRWIVARVMAHIIKRFPFVRGIFISGDLAKNVAHPDSDVDYVIVTVPGRLWICRTLLIVFKKVFLLNKKKYFCLNYFVTTHHLESTDKNYFTATEIAHLKPLYNFSLFLSFLNANKWIKNFFPNYLIFLNNVLHCNNRPSLLQRILELPFHGSWAEALDRWLMKQMGKVWKRRYPHLNDNDLDFRFRCSPDESRAFGQELGTTILGLYYTKLQRFNLRPPKVYE